MRYVDAVNDVARAKLTRWAHVENLTLLTNYQVRQDSRRNTFTTAAAPATTPIVSVTSPSGENGYGTEGGKAKDKHLLITVALLDDLGNEVAGASVSIDLFRDDSFVASGTSTTGTNGTVTFTLKNAKPGCYTTTVTGVTADGLTWDDTTPANQYCK